MLSTTYRYSAYNASGASSDVTVQEIPWKIDSNGALVLGAARTNMNAVTIANASRGTGSTQDNSTDKYLGANLVVSATGAGSGGPITIYLEISPDAGTSWPDSRKGIPVGSLNAGDTGVNMAV